MQRSEKKPTGTHEHVATNTTSTTQPICTQRKEPKQGYEVTKRKKGTQARERVVTKRSPPSVGCSNSSPWANPFVSLRYTQRSAHAMQALTTTCGCQTHAVCGPCMVLTPPTHPTTLGSHLLLQLNLKFFKLSKVNPLDPRYPYMATRMAPYN